MHNNLTAKPNLQFTKCKLTTKFYFHIDFSQVTLINS